MTQGQPRIPPHSDDAERAVLGAALVEAGVIERVAELLSEEDFYDPKNAAIFAQAKSLAAAGNPVDIVTICAALKAAGHLAMAGGAGHVASLVDGYVSAANVMFHARIVKDLALLRRMIRAAAELVHRAYEPVDDIEAFVDEAEQSIFAIAQDSRRRRSLRNLGDTMNEWFIRVGLNSGEMVLRSIRKDDLHTDYVPIGHSVNLAARMESLATHSTPERLSWEEFGDDLRMDYTAQGQTVGLAARMEQLAAPGSAYVTEHTAKLVSGFFQLRDLGSFEIKGMRDPVSIRAAEVARALES